MNNYVVTTVTELAEPVTNTRIFDCPFRADAAFWKAVEDSKRLQDWGIPMSVTLVSENPSDFESPCGCSACREAEAYDDLPRLSDGLSHSNCC